MSQVIYRGPSSIDPDVTIRVVVTSGTVNAKLTDRLNAKVFQTWYLLDDVHPVDGIHTGQDEAICDDCRLRRVVDGT